MLTDTKKAYDTASDEIDLGRLFGMLLDAKWVIIGTTFLFAVLGVVYALMATPIYKADALIQVESKNSGVSTLISDGLGDIFSQESSASTEIEIINSRMVLGETVDKLNLTTIAVPKTLPIIGKGLSRLQGEQLSIDIARFEMPEYLAPVSLTLTVKDDKAESYQVTTEDGKLVLAGRTGELAENGDWQLFCTPY